eukprot:TRINITY_DN23644_c0_g1_i1.p1 TRINITY_DN23644_c0_g1~~TRINITY_DN23644_c0_g1_i1.p1  ORF type:complete len:163 (+),score=31.59 TRINITY_DN23644_c0_g1_i1:120-608(+)
MPRCQSAVGLFLMLTASALADDSCSASNQNFRVQYHGETMFEVNQSGICICAEYRGSGAGIELDDNPTVRAMRAEIDLLKAQVQHLTSLMSPQHSGTTNAGSTGSGTSSAGTTSTGTTSVATTSVANRLVYLWGQNMPMVISSDGATIIMASLVTEDRKTSN